MARAGNVYLRWAGQIDRPAGPPNPCAQPRPVPPLEVRPNSLSITDIETWINDPYAIYAKRILKLAPLDPLQRAPDARERGNLYHDIVEDFVKHYRDPNDADALAKLVELARAKFAEAEIPVEYAVQWWPRFEKIAANLVVWQQQQMQEADEIHVELKGETDRDLDGFVLRGRADRIDITPDDQAVLYDYKSGQPPSKPEQTYFNKQLVLETAMLEAGAFPSIGPRRVATSAIGSTSAACAISTSEGVTPIRSRVRSAGSQRRRRAC